MFDHLKALSKSVTANSYNNNHSFIVILYILQQHELLCKRYKKDIALTGVI